MDAKKRSILNFHQNLGKLFFAIAAVDGSVRVEELDKLKKIVKKEWLSTNFVKDDLKVDAEQAIINTFRWLRDDNEYNANECYNSFLVYMKNHKELFTDDVNKLIIKTASKIATSFSKMNKSELMLLAKLDMELKNN